MVNYPLRLWPRDTLSKLTLNDYPIPDMVVGQKITFDNEAELIDFINRSILTEMEFENYPVLFGLFGGSATREREMVWVLPDAVF